MTKKKKSQKNSLDINKVLDAAAVVTENVLKVVKALNGDEKDSKKKKKKKKKNKK